ncbi:MAG: sigma-70 family RNA polymerase sigma factor [Lewinellaceae bacterium]|nr:sigma-70 family RNA polymerase sigma factor [Saprospiraceae bacterium]MCB9337059.1 sigma-70 family RNA polymerase sigma factor [Lewinellaceae bacterium]
MELTLTKHTSTTTSNSRLSPKASEDYQLVQAAIEGDQQAFASLLERYRASVYNHLYKMVRNHDDAEDLTLEAFGKAFHKLSTYAPHFAFSTWLFKIAVNNCIDHIRKKRLQFLSIDAPMERSGDKDFTGSIRTGARNPEEEVIRNQRLQMVKNSLGYLSHKYRLMIELRYYEELSYEEIATELDIPLGTVKAQLFRAKEMLYTLMQKPGHAAYLESTRRFN